ncbi:alpha/beta hydrolase family protein [Wenzhouxiangella limi]|uniref:Acyl-peptide hydrolase n=1 Tax=Wenzhouxiangella limi TaxID=2707351 RepID=A0A845UTJ5_9GAMM|nr:S9 family peptidase [Wenzhouxiangella limi]NDY95143.1 S9 family peptidase [Wenzhouxiangella limi]
MLKQMFWILLLVPMLASAQDTRPLSVDVLWEMDRVGSPVVSPAGGDVVVPVTSYDTETDESETRLWLLSTEGEVQRPLTQSGASAGNPVFAPDGKTLAFTARRDEDEAAQIYLLPMDGPGEATRLSEVPTGVSALKWVGEHIYFISRVWPDKTWQEMAEQRKADEESKVSAHQWNALPYSQWDHWIEEDRQAHVFRIPAAGGDVEAITQPLGRELPRSSQGTGSYDIHPDETHIAFTSNSSEQSVHPEIDLFLARIGQGDARNLTPDNPAGDGNPMFSPDGQMLAWGSQAIPGFYADTVNIMVLDLDSDERRNVTADWDRSPGGLVWAADSTGFFGTAADNGTTRVFHIALEEGRVRAITDQTDFGGLSIAEDGTLVGSNQSFLYPPRVVRINADNGAALRLDTFNDEVLANVDLGTYESVTYTGHNGADIQMWVHYPPGFDPDGEYPLFLLIHGGPHSPITDGFHFRWNAQTFASWGYVTAWHNFHGSPGWGQDFADYINPDWITAPYNDTVAAAEWFADKDWIDDERMVAGGGSYGGYLASILLGKEHPFNALLIHAPVYNMYSQMAADFAVHSARFGDFWDEPQIYRDISPHYFAEDFDTPALIIHGQNDLRVPVGQAFELFRTLQSKGIESRLIYYPDENHWILKPNNSVYWYNEVQRWMEQFAEPGPR